MPQVLFSIFIHCGHNMFYCRGAIGQVILPQSTYDSSLDLSDMFPPLYFLSFITCSQSASLISSLHFILTLPFTLSMDRRCELHHELSLLSYFWLQPSLLHHLQRIDRQIGDHEAQVKERGGGKSRMSRQEVGRKTQSESEMNKWIIKCFSVLEKQKA